MATLTDFQFSELLIPVRFGAQNEKFKNNQNSILEFLEKNGFKHTQNYADGKFWTYSLFESTNVKISYKEFKKIVKKSFPGATVDLDCSAIDNIDQKLFNPKPAKENPSVFDCISILFY